MDAACLHLQETLLDLLRARRDPDFVQRAPDWIFNVPPRSSKSTLVSVFFPAWAWLLDPSLAFMCLSANPHVSQRDSRDWRELVGSRWYLGLVASLGGDWIIKENEDALGHVANTARGRRDARGLNANVIGLGCDVLIIDDPHDEKELTDYKRTEVLDRYDQGVHNRVNDPLRCMRVLVMQRLHQDDLAGHLLATGKWNHLMIPMEFDAARACETVYGWRDPRTEEGELLQPERFPREWVAAERDRLKEYGYAAKHQQTPSPKGGGMFPREAWRFWKPDGVAAGAAQRPKGCTDLPARPLPAKFDAVHWSLDTASRSGAHNDWDVLTVWGVHGADLYLLERLRVHLELDKLCEAIIALEGRLRARGYRVHARLVEGRARGDSVVQLLGRPRAQGGTALPGIITIDPKESKEVRAAAAQPRVTAGNVHIPEGAPWLDEWVDEFAMFPVGSHDDQVDSYSQLEMWISEQGATWKGEALAKGINWNRLSLG